MIDSKELLNNLRQYKISSDVFYNMIKNETRYRYKIDSANEYLHITGINACLRIPCNGVYVMFEEDGLKERIVRIGINGAIKGTNQNNNRLLSRIISNHYLGEGGSSFRKLVAKALDVKDAKDNKVSTFIKKSISFTIIDVDDFDSRNEMETLLIELLAKNNWQSASKNWLGAKDSSDDVVWASGLWNKDKVPNNLVKCRIKDILRQNGFDTTHDYVDSIISCLRDYKKYSHMPNELTAEDIDKYKNDIKSASEAFNSALQNGFDLNKLKQISIAVLESGLFDEL